MQITVIAVSNNVVPTKSGKGTYNQLEVTFKDGQGKVGSRKLMSFVTDSKPAFDVLVNASQNETYEVTAVKQGEYWTWTNAVRVEAGAAQATAAPKAGNAAPKSTYETPEERAKKQVYIVRQSSISSAIDLLSVGSKNPPKVVDVLKTAKEFEDFVFNGTTGDLVTDVSSLEDENLFQEIPL